jgi:hypothetical protein
MDLAQTIRRLRKERKKIEQMIEGLQALRAKEAVRAAMPPPVKKRRGRKSMGDEERAVVSARMKAYWAGRRVTANERGE